MMLTLTERDLDLLDALTLRVRLLTLRQVTELWWPTARTSGVLAADSNVWRWRSSSKYIE